MGPYTKIFSIFLALGECGVCTTAGTSNEHDITTNPEEPLVGGAATIYDFIVVGGGTAGLTVATRLAQQSFNVAVVEAGTHYENISLAWVPEADVLVGRPSVNATTNAINWGFSTVPMPGANNRQISYSRGKCLGGSSALNFMIYQRPTEGTMQTWAEAVNDSSYLFDQTLPYYQRSINFTTPDAAVRSANSTASYDPDAFAADGAPVHVSYADYPLPFSSWMERGMAAIGIKSKKEGFNSGSLFGSQYFSTTLNPSDHTRSSSDSFLREIQAPTLTVYDNTRAHRILFDQNKRATGVEITGNLKNGTIKARNEVILSAGAVQSPQLLMLSGIGPAETLQKHGIETLLDAPGVGQNLWDHPVLGLSYRVNVQSFGAFAKLLNGPFDNLTGPLGNPGADFGAWEKIPSSLRSDFSGETQRTFSQFADDWPEVEYLAGVGLMRNDFDYIGDQPQDGYQYEAILGCIVAPVSRGYVTIASSNVFDAPIINPNFLGEVADQEMALAMFKRIRQAFQSPAMAPVVLGEEIVPGPAVQSDEGILAWIRDNIQTIFHPSCTCKMGQSDDPMAVVDSEAKVFGIEGLRVVDASAFPILPPGHPQSTVYMLAEKISEKIIREHRGQAE